MHNTYHPIYLPTRIFRSSRSQQQHHNKIQCVFNVLWVDAANDVSRWVGMFLVIFFKSTAATTAIIHLVCQWRKLFYLAHSLFIILSLPPSTYRPLATASSSFPFSPTPCQVLNWRKLLYSCCIIKIKISTMCSQCTVTKPTTTNSTKTTLWSVLCMLFVLFFSNTLGWYTILNCSSFLSFSFPMRFI